MTSFPTPAAPALRTEQSSTQRRSERARTRRGMAIATGVAALAAVVATGAYADNADAASQHGSLTVHSKGNGHGHGMSQYGAYGAALRGLNYAQILRFYYPGTRLTDVRSSRISVLLSNTGQTLTVRPASYLTVTGVSGVLASTGVSRYRLVAAPHSTLALQRRMTGVPGYRTIKRGLPSSAEFRRGPRHAVRTYLTDGSSTSFYGRVIAVRTSSHSVEAVNRLMIDSYTRGVVPREMPSSWAPAAIQAQAVAARTYGRYAVLHPRSRHYDICDTTMCQVYGGHTHYTRSGSVAWRDDPDALTNDRGKVLTYHSRTIFAQFSASNGGWTADGGEPYLVARRDPYDAAGSRNPYTSDTKHVSLASLARYFGMHTVTRVAVTKRDGHGVWGGRVITARLYGTSSSGKAMHKTVGGSDLQWALGLGTTWFSVTR